MTHDDAKELELKHRKASEERKTREIERVRQESIREAGGRPKLVATHASLKDRAERMFALDYPDFIETLRILEIEPGSSTERQLIRLSKQKRGI